MERATSCLCLRCASVPDHPDVTLHARIGALLSYATTEERPYVAAMLDQAQLWGVFDDALLAEIAGLSAGDIGESRRRLRMQENELVAHRSRSIVALGDDERTRQLLLAAFNARHDQWVRFGSDAITLRVRTAAKVIEVCVPPTLDSFLLLFEIFVDEPYRPPLPVPVIYDVGANIGLAALYLHSHLPDARLVCVEPVPANARLLRENLERNDVDATIVEAALTGTPGPVRLRCPRNAHSLASLFTDGDELDVAPLTPAGLFIGEGFGVKLDVEGAEHTIGMAALSRASFIVGELHHGQAIVPAARTANFQRALEQHFDVDAGHAEVFGLTLTRAFRAVRRRVD